MQSPTLIAPRPLVLRPYPSPIKQQPDPIIERELDYNTVPRVIQPPTSNKIKEIPLSRDDVPRVIQEPLVAKKTTMLQPITTVPKVLQESRSEEHIREWSIPTVSGNTVIKMHENEEMSEDEFYQYIEYLKNEQTKYDIFSRLFPSHTCEGVRMRMETYYSNLVSISPSRSELVMCIKEKESMATSVAILLTYGTKSNIIWIDTHARSINRYDPFTEYGKQDQIHMDKTLEKFFLNILPNYKYLGNTLDTTQCLSVSNTYCQDYALLYTINRVSGMSHDDAAEDLIERGDTLETYLTELLHALAYRIRKEMGKSIPMEYENWRH